MSNPASGSVYPAAIDTNLTLRRVVDGVDILYEGDHNEVVDAIIAIENKLGITSAIRPGDGTVSLPAYSFANDEDTGFYRAGPGDVRFALNGVRKLTFDSNGVTIAGTVPMVVLDNDTGTANGRLLSVVSGEWVGIAENLSFDGTNFNFDDTARPGWLWKLDGRAGQDKAILYRAAPSANPATITEFLKIDSAGSLFIGNQSAMYIAGSSSGLYINDTSNASMTAGLTINQGAADDEILSLKSSDVAHGVTGETETDTYATFKKAVVAGGGLVLAAFNNVAYSLFLRGIGTGEDTTKGTGSFGSVVIDAAKKSGTGIASLAANGNMVVFRDQVAGAARFIFDVEGDSHEDGTGWTAYDEYDDIALLEAVDTSLDKRLRAEVGDWLTENKRMLEAARIVSFNDDTDGRPFVNRSRLQMLLVGAVRQQARQIDALKIDTIRQLAVRIDGMEQKMQRLIDGKSGEAI